MLPSLFLAHGAPLLLDDTQWVAELLDWSRALPRPRAVLSVSAHWVDRHVALGATRTVPLVYDFSGFPERFYRLKYPAPGAPDLADRVEALLGAAGIPSGRSPEHGLDHGTWVPLMCMYPSAGVPVLQISLPPLVPRALLDLGAALAPLSDEDVLILGSGFLTHNHAQAFVPGPPPWAREFDAWTADALSRLDTDALLDFQARAPYARLALPTWEHFAPVLVALGAALARRPHVTFPITGFWMDGSLTRRSVQFG